MPAVIILTLIIFFEAPTQHNCSKQSETAATPPRRCLFMIGFTPIRKKPKNLAAFAPSRFKKEKF